MSDLIAQADQAVDRYLADQKHLVPPTTASGTGTDLPTENGKHRRPRPLDVNALVQKRRAELVEYERQLADAEEDVRVLRFNIAVTKGSIAAHEKFTDDAPTRKPGRKPKATPDQ